MAYLVTGNAGYNMSTPRYLPGSGATVSYTKKTSAEIDCVDPSTGERFILKGAFAASSEWKDMVGTITSFQAIDANGQLEYFFGDMNMQFGPAVPGSGSYFSFANTTTLNFLGFQFTALGASGQVFGGTGSDRFIGYTGTHTFSGGGGHDTLDYSTASANTNLTIVIPSGKTTSNFGTDLFSGIETFIGSSQPGSHTYFVNGAGNHTFIAQRSAPPNQNSPIFNDLYLGVQNAAGVANLPPPNTPVIVNIATGIASLNGYGGTDFYNPSVFSATGTVHLGGTSTYIIGQAGVNNVTVEGTQPLTIDYSRAQGGVTVTSNANSLTIQTPANGSSDTITNASNHPLDFIGGPGQNNINVTNLTGTDKTIDYSLQPGAVVVNLNNNSAQNAFGFNDTITGFNKVTGSNFNDIIYANAAVNVIHGLGGSDNISGTGNGDTAFGDDGSDLLYFVGNQNQLFGGGGNDWLGVNGNNNALVGGDGDEVWMGASGNGNTLAGGNGQDSLYVNGSANYLTGEGSSDWLGCSGNSNQLLGADGNEWMGATGNGNALAGGEGDDTLYSNGSNVLFGENGNDWVGASGTGNYLSGGGGNDYVAASGNQNVFDGGAGNDQLVVGGGHTGDRFIFHPGYGMDTIYNFSRHNAGGTDLIDLQGFGITANTIGQYLSYQANGVAVITINAATVLTLANGVPANGLALSDFVF